MSKGTIYIAGKVTGLPPEPTARKFEAMEKEIAAKGYKVINPIKLVNDPNASWNSAMKKCLAALKQCNGIMLLPCSIDSPGAQLELETAIKLNLDLYEKIEELN